ncbi:MAG: hypothetical protein V7637_6413, partial [Mycobacteriales bacterium]
MATDLTRAAAEPAPAALEHPSWCDPERCTADSAATDRDGYRVGHGGEHQSAPIRLDLSASIELLPARSGTAYLSEAAAPWRCSAYLRVRVGDAAVSLPVEHARPLLAGL